MMDTSRKIPDDELNALVINLYQLFYKMFYMIKFMSLDVPVCKRMGHEMRQ